MEPILMIRCCRFSQVLFLSFDLAILHIFLYFLFLLLKFAYKNSSERSLIDYFNDLI